MRTTIKLTQDQRNKIDNAVLGVLNATQPKTATVIAVSVEQVLGKELPKRPDFHRYVDSAIQRLREAGKIKSPSTTAVGCRGGWLLS